MRFLLATHNKKKCAELQRILSPLGIEVFTASMLGMEITDAEETGSTFAENARIKSDSACAETGLPAIGDDSGLCVDFLDGAPGVFSARFSGVHGDDGANIDKLLRVMENVPDEERTAKFVCSICVSFPDGSHLTATGECAGNIARERHGDNGFGYDPVFMIGSRSFAEMSKEEKDAVSHRGNALRELKKVLEQRLTYQGETE